MTRGKKFLKKSNGASLTKAGAQQYANTAAVISALPIMNY